MKISASIYSAKAASLPALLKELDNHGVNLLHVDCNDDAKVFADIEQINQLSNTPVDLHIISSTPEKYFEAIAVANPSQVSFQYENFPAPIEFPKNRNYKIGLAITSATNIDVFESYQAQCDYILLMTTTPGQSGGTFDKNTFLRIREFQKRFPKIPVQVDGGVNAEVSFILRHLGVQTAVVGSYLFKQETLGAALLQLHRPMVGSHYQISDFMLSINELPILTENELSLRKALQSIDDYKMAFTCICDAAGHLTGLISNADIRKGLLKQWEAWPNIDVHQLINRTPLKIQESATIHGLLEFIQQVDFPVQYLPVVDAQNKLKGAVLFTQLIKGEL